MRVFLSLLLFTISISAFAQVAKKQLSEKEKIEALIQYVADLNDAKFYRNGSVYTAQEAAKHLRMKWNNAGSKVKTASDFIDKLASKSSITGQDYKIIFNNGKEIKASVFFYNELKKLRASQ